MTAALLALPVVAAATAADLSAVVAAALSRSPSAAQARARRLEAEAAGREVFWSRWPRLGASASLSRGDDPLYAFGALLQSRRVTAADFDPASLNRPGYRTAARGGLELGVPLFTGFALSRARSLAGLSAEEAQAAGDAASQAVRLRAVEAYVGMLMQDALHEELEARVASAERSLEGAQRLAKRGLVLGSDHQAALAVFSGLKAASARAAAGRAARRAELSVLLGGPAPEPAGTLGDWDPPLEDDGALVEAALERRPQLRASGARTRAAGLRRRAAAQSLLPTVEAFAALNAASEGWSSAAGSRIAGVRATLGFGDPAYFSRRARAAAGEAAARAEEEAGADDARAEVLARAEGVRGSVAVLRELNESLARAREALERVRPLYREGRQSVLEVLRAEEAVARMEEARLATAAGLRSEWAALRAAQGSLDDRAVAALSRSLGAAR